jgi:hypothetical protein
VSLLISLLLIALLLLAFLLIPLLLIALLLLSLLLLSLLLFPLLPISFLLFSLLLFSLLLISLLVLAFLLFSLLLISLLLFPLLLLAFLLLPLLLLLFLLLIGLPKHHLGRDAQSKRKQQHGGCLTDLPKDGSDYRKKNGLMRQTFGHSCRLHSAGSPSLKNLDPGAETAAGVTSHHRLGAALHRKDTLENVNVLRDRVKKCEARPLRLGRRGGTALPVVS